MICFSELLFLNLYVKFLWCRYSGFFVCYIKLLIMYMFVLMSSNAFRACYFFLPINGRAGTTFLFFIIFDPSEILCGKMYFYYFSFYFWFLCQRKFIICVKCSVLFFCIFYNLFMFFFSLSCFVRPMMFIEFTEEVWINK